MIVKSMEICQTCYRFNSILLIFEEMDSSDLIDLERNEGQTVGLINIQRITAQRYSL